MDDIPPIEDPIAKTNLGALRQASPEVVGSRGRFRVVSSVDFAEPWKPPQPQPHEPEEVPAISVRDSLTVWLKSIDLSQMHVLDRMNFDINVRTLANKGRERLVASSQISPKANLGSVPVYERLIEDINRRNTVKQRLEEYAKVQEELKAESPTKGMGRPQSEAVFNRLLNDVDRRTGIKHATEQFKAKEVEYESQFLLAVKSMTKEEKAKMILRLNGNTYAGEAELRQRKLDAAQQDKKEREAEEVFRLANLHHPKRALDPKVQERLTHEQKTIEENYGVAQLSNDTGLNKDLPHKKLFSVSDSIKSGTRLMNAKVFRSRKEVDPRTYSPQRKLREDQNDLVMGQLSPNGFSNSGAYIELSGDFSDKAKAADYSPTDLRFDVGASDLKRKPIRLRARPNSGSSLVSSPRNPPTNFMKEIKQVGKYNHSKAFVSRKRSPDKSSSERFVPQPNSARLASPNKSPSPHKSPIKRPPKTPNSQGKFSIFVAADAWDNSEPSSALRSPSNSGGSSSHLYAAREALSLPHTSSYSPFGTGAADRPVAPKELDKNKAVSNLGRVSPSRSQPVRQDTIIAAITSPSNRLNSKKSDKFPTSKPFLKKHNADLDEPLPRSPSKTTRNTPRNITATAKNRQQR